MLETDGKRIRMEWNRDKRMHSLSILRFENIENIENVKDRY